MLHVKKEPDCSFLSQFSTKLRCRENCKKKQCLVRCLSHLLQSTHYQFIFQEQFFCSEPKPDGIPTLLNSLWCCGIFLIKLCSFSMDIWWGRWYYWSWQVCRGGLPPTSGMTGWHIQHTKSIILHWKWKRQRLSGETRQTSSRPDPPSYTPTLHTLWHTCT